VDLNAGLEALEKIQVTCTLPKIEPRLLGRPICSVLTTPTEPSRLQLEELSEETLARAEDYCYHEIINIVVLA
jgi:hypothetical protein